METSAVSGVRCGACSERLRLVGGDRAVSSLFSPAGRSAERMRGDEGVFCIRLRRFAHPLIRPTATFSPLGRRGSTVICRHHIIVDRRVRRHRHRGCRCRATALQDHHRRQHLAQFRHGRRRIGDCHRTGLRLARSMRNLQLRMQVAVGRAGEAHVGRQEEMPLPGGLIGAGGFRQEAQPALRYALLRLTIVRRAGFLTFMERSRRKIRSGNTHGTCKH